MRKHSVFSRIYAGIGIFLLVMLIAVGILISIPSDTVDFRGTVDSIVFNDEENCAYITATGVFGEHMEICASGGILVQDLSGNKYNIKAIRPGDMIDLDYREYPAEDTALVSAKWIKVSPGASLPKETSGTEQPSAE